MKIFFSTLFKIEIVNGEERLMYCKWCTGVEELPMSYRGWKLRGKGLSYVHERSESESVFKPSCQHFRKKIDMWSIPHDIHI